MKLVVASLSLVHFAAAASDSPIGKAIQLLGDLQTKILKEGDGAQQLYAEFTEFCEEGSKNLDHEIKTGKAQAAELQAVIDEQTATIGALATNIEKLTGDISVDEADLKAATEIREKEASSFHAAEHELTSVVDTLQRAIGIVEREMQKGGASMLQLKGAENLAQALSALVEASMISTAEAGRVTSLAQTATDSDDVGAPAAAVYESHSGNIVQVLTNLLDDAEGQLKSARDKEMEDRNAFEMLEQGIKDEIKFGNKELEEAKVGSAAASEHKAAAEGDHEMTSKELATDETSLTELHHECMTKAENFESETKSRGEEVEALAQAKQALKDNVGAAEGLSYGLAQVSFVQATARITSRAGLAQFEVARLVRDLARKHNSAALAQLAAKIGAAVSMGSRLNEDPFAKIRGLIQDMVERLEKEAAEDATKKAWCDKELAETTEKKADKTTAIEKLTTALDQMSARTGQLKEEIAALEKGLSELTTAQAEMDKIRAEENSAYKQNKADMEQGLTGVKLALKILNEYYAKGDKAHASAEGSSSGIIGLIEVVESDFTKGLAEMTATEESAQNSYDTETKENEIEKVTKEQDVKYKTKESNELDQSIAETTSDRAGEQAELDAVLQYLAKIEGQCVERAETYEERHARFEAELAGLKEALRVLQDETALVQKASTRKLRGVHRHA